MQYYMCVRMKFKKTSKGFKTQVEEKDCWYTEFALVISHFNNRFKLL